MMNCQEFAGMVNELAAQRLMDAVTRQRALRHTTACAGCAARLAAEQELTVRLRAFTEDSMNEQTPARVRETLRAAFAEHQRETVAPIVAPRRQPFIKWAIVAAAAALVLFTVAVSLWLRSQSATQQKQVVDVILPPTPLPEATAPVLIDSPSNPPALVAKRSLRQSAATARRATAHPQPQATAAASGDEIATNYIPLTYTAHADTPQDGMVVRVEVARATLLGMGLPLNAERGQELIKADVMMSGDGVPLAIRLVQR